jgi:hypothetical protein
MNSSDVVIAVAGWEQRFLKGLERDIETHEPASIVLLAFEEYKEMTRANREALSRQCNEKRISLQEVTLRREPKEVWRSLQELFGDASFSDKKILLDISTMPREVIWWSLKFLQRRASTISFVYHRPGGYASDWLTRDTGEPRLVYQCSGIARLGKPTGLLLLSGFDSDRALRMIQYFEPSLILLGIQNGEQFDNQSKNINPAREISERMTLVNAFDMNAFGVDWGFEAMSDAVRPALATHNIIAASLGPKVSGISLFMLHCTYPQIALAYAPSRQFNVDYSSGIGDSISGSVPFCEPAQEST